jgi:hypothetical protein
LPAQVEAPGVENPSFRRKARVAARTKDLEFASRSRQRGSVISGGVAGAAQEASGLSGLGGVPWCTVTAAAQPPRSTELVTSTIRSARGVDYNQKLSEERAGTALACIVGDELRDKFGELCDGQNDGVDKTQCIDWASKYFSWDCKPSRTDQAPASSTVKKFARRQKEIRPGP